MFVSSKCGSDGAAQACARAASTPGGGARGRAHPERAARAYGAAASDPHHYSFLHHRLPAVQSRGLMICIHAVFEFPIKIS